MRKRKEIPNELKKGMGKERYNSVPLCVNI